MMMKKMILSLIALLAIAAQASAMSYEQARNEALFLTDKMAYELNLTDAQYEAAYEINLDYLMGVTSRNDVFGTYWERRNADIQYILYRWQWDAFCAASYFYRPLYWSAGYWHFGIYARYPHRDYFYFGRPHFYVSYRGGHSWRMNGGHSYYANRHDHYRPHADRSHHSGMRDGWDRGDYRNDRGRSYDNHRDNGGRHYDNNRGTSGRHDDNNHGSNGRHDDNNHGSNGQATVPSNRPDHSTGNRSASTVSSTRTTANHRSTSGSANRSVGASATRSTGASANRSTGASANRSTGASATRGTGASANRSASGGSRGSAGGSRSAGRR